MSPDEPWVRLTQESDVFEWESIFGTHRSRMSVHASHEALTLHSPVAYRRSPSFTLASAHLASAYLAYAYDPTDRFGALSEGKLNSVSLPIPTSSS
jgi:hypothetical protein